VDVVPLRWFGESESGSLAYQSDHRSIVPTRTHSTTTRHESFPGPGDVGNITLSGVFEELYKGPVRSALVERDDIGLPVGTQT